MIEQVRGDTEGADPPAGLEGAKEIMLLVDRASGVATAVILFESEEAMMSGDAALNAMSPGGSTERSGVEFYEVAVRRSR
jgi:hypothetical protein